MVIGQQGPSRILNPIKWQACKPGGHNLNGQQASEEVGSNLSIGLLCPPETIHQELNPDPG